MAASRDRASDMDSVDEAGFRSGTDSVHVEMSDARVGVKKGCGDCWTETGFIGAALWDVWRWYQEFDLTMDDG